MDKYKNNEKASIVALFQTRQRENLF